MQADIEHAMTHRTNVMVEDGEVRAVIGRGTDGGRLSDAKPTSLDERSESNGAEKVILSIIGGTIVAAEALERPSNTTQANQTATGMTSW